MVASCLGDMWMNGNVGRLDGVGVGLTNIYGEVGAEMGEAEKERGL